MFKYSFKLTLSVETGLKVCSVIEVNILLDFYIIFISWNSHRSREDFFIENKN